MKKVAFTYEVGIISFRECGMEKVYGVVKNKIKKFLSKDSEGNWILTNYKMPTYYYTSGFKKNDITLQSVLEYLNHNGYEVYQFENLFEFSKWCEDKYD